MEIDNSILFQKLPDKDIKCKPFQLRVLRFDPVNLPILFKPNPFERHQNVSITDLFPIRTDGFCACGCEKELEGRRLRWATDDCQNFAVAVRFIIYGATDTISRYMRLYYGWKCFKCKCNDKGHNMGANGVVSWIKVDHIIPVKLGGGACWLSNYQLLCHDCHTHKTNTDFGWKLKTKMPTLFNAE